MHTIPIRTDIFKESDCLFDFIDTHIQSMREGDVFVITSKIIALSQHRVGAISSKKTLIQNESDECIETPWATLTRHGIEWRINAGIDESNAHKQLILLPLNPFLVAHDIAVHLQNKFKISNCAVIISDTRSSALRKGTTGKAIGFFGIKPLRSYINKKDLFGRRSRVTQSNMVDALATTAVLEMGEGNEQIPMVLIHDAPVSFTSKKPTSQERELSIQTNEDIFSYIFNVLRKHSKNSIQRSSYQKP